MSDTTTDILVVDDHPLFREALRGLITRLYPTTAIYEADNISTLYALIEDRPNADLLLLQDKVSEEPVILILIETDPHEIEIIKEFN